MLYVADLAAVISQHGLSPHQYADDAQIYGSCSPTDLHAFSLKVSEFLNDVASWMRCNRLQLNPGKTELLWCSTDQRRHRLPTSALMTGSPSVLPVSTVRDLRIFVDCDLVMRTHVCRTVHCLAMLSHLRSIRYLVSESVFQSLVTALVLCRLVTVRWLVFRSTFNDASSRSRTQPLV